MSVGAPWFSTGRPDWQDPDGRAQDATKSCQSAIGKLKAMSDGVLGHGMVGNNDTQIDMLCFEWELKQALFGTAKTHELTLLPLNNVSFDPTHTR